MFPVLLIWLIALASIAGVLFRPFKTTEWPWALGGAVALVVTTLLPVSSALTALKSGVDVFFFLIGMMLLSELARTSGLFDWIAAVAVDLSKGSMKLLLLYTYLAGVLVTCFLSNDATAVVLTPAVFAATKRAGGDGKRSSKPLLFACALVSNAASFLLPISNPANLVIFQKNLPPIGEWIKTFGLASLGSIAATYAVLYFWFRKDLSVKLESSAAKPHKLSREGLWVSVGLFTVVVVLLVCSAYEVELGLPTLMSALVVTSIISVYRRAWPKTEIRSLSWSVIPLVGGLFVVVEAINRAGALEATTRFFEWASRGPVFQGMLSSAFGVAGLSNILNNLPVGLTSGLAAQSAGVSQAIRHAVLIGVDLGPNLSVTGSLATILWLISLRREGASVDGWSFFKLGLFAMPIAMLAALGVLALIV